jgi:hypothetical protein
MELMEVNFGQFLKTKLRPKLGEILLNLVRVARWYILKPKIPIWLRLGWHWI